MKLRSFYLDALIGVRRVRDEADAEAPARNILRFGAGFVVADDPARGTTNVTVATGAVAAHASTHIHGGSDPVDGDKISIDYTSAVYTPVPSAVPGGSGVSQHLAAHLAGLAAKIATLAAPTWAAVLAAGASAGSIDPDVNSRALLNVGSVRGAGTIPALGFARLANNVTAIGYKTAGGADVGVLSFSSADQLNIGDATNVATLMLRSAGSVLLRPTGAGTNEYLFSATEANWVGNNLIGLGSSVQFVSTATAPILNQADLATASATGETLSIRGQNAVGATSTGGGLDLRSGTGTTAAGPLTFRTGATTRLTVAAAGSFDFASNALQNLSSARLVEAATVPGGAPGAGNGTFWVKNNTPNIPVFTDDAGVDHNLALATGAGAFTWADALANGASAGVNDPDINSRNLLNIGSARMAGTVATVGWLRVPHNPGVAILSGRDSTNTGDRDLLTWGATSNVLQVGTSTITQLLLDGGTAIRFATPGVSWASTTASPVLFQDSDATASATGDTLTIRAQTCTGATSTGGILDLRSGSGTSSDGELRLRTGTTARLAISGAGTINVFSNNIQDVGSLRLDEAATVPGGNPGTGNGTFWIKNDAPNTPWFTDDTNADRRLAYLTDIPATSTWAAVLTAGASAGSTDPDVNSRALLNVGSLRAAGTIATSGLIRVPHNQAIINGRDNANANNTTLLSWGAAGTDILALGSTTIVATVTIRTAGNIDLRPTGSGSAEYTFDSSQANWAGNSLIGLGPGLQFITSASSPRLSQADRTTGSATGETLSVTAQTCTGATSIGGALNLASGTGTSKDGEVRLSPGGTTKLRVIDYVPAAGDNPASGSWYLYEDSGVIRLKGASGTITDVGSA